MSVAIHLFEDYYYREVTTGEFAPMIAQYRSQVFDSIIAMPVEDWMTGSEMQRRQDYDEMVNKLFELRILITKGDKVIGWHNGRQGLRDAAHMSSTGLLQEDRGQGIYTALLPHLLHIYHDHGFAKITSRHQISNNAVLVPKLKAGFIITGFEIDERYGLFAVLSYIFNEDRLHAYKYRTGAVRPNESIRRYL